MPHILLESSSKDFVCDEKFKFIANGKFDQKIAVIVAVVIVMDALRAMSDEPRGTRKNPCRPGTSSTMRTGQS